MASRFSAANPDFLSTRSQFLAWLTDILVQVE
ncbi:hypothetical protein EHW99_1472 [Erwinia amylovora]|uniref:Uncharacterized protein n=2 Tax=Erwinia amylovora TaxID=552 RepID=A0A831A311_ERWAM|nr:hypothetical protein EaACW_2125 [Erwinia amylovora ACW56400]QJQ54177.1 hypothetical protein EHX00_1472 [Erwinia amylovora]CBA21083.1 hypothetical protein predicted by Glimmer/Critica [Erwinia amylovora CFBP1430]CCO78971.1 hypothetical protein BN432_2176 [Erwinia amylovora Ea356]CCO82772.1 hypothetical protein BN433_2204 [Erwinia amylovora Ea266]CCO94103.1 hypothetical protein BN437_2176 [Erwinia amylovora NBRC 12687 = CFBP 1232]CCO99449.1 hypothetical protein BN438_2169 [Erwinia amylovora 